MAELRVLFAGLGSIGKRHLQNLYTEVGALNAAGADITLVVHAMRYSKGPLPSDIAPLVAQYFEMLPDGATYDIAFITNPTHLHARALGLLENRVGTFFIEKPIFQNTGYDLAQLGLEGGQKAYVAAPMRWCGVFLELERLVRGGLKPYSVRALCSSYLPEWRAGVDYRTVYSAKREMGGGVTLDLIHEWDYLTHLFGFPEEVFNLRGTFSHLEIDADDLSVYIARYPHFLCELHLDYFGRAYRRDLELLCEEGTLKADFGSGVLTLPSGETMDCTEPVNKRYEREMAAFLAYALDKTGTLGAPGGNTPQNALRVLKTTLGEK